MHCSSSVSCIAIVKSRVVYFLARIGLGDLSFSQHIAQANVQSFIFPRGRGGGMHVDACKGCMRVSVHPLDFNEILDTFSS